MLSMQWPIQNQQQEHDKPLQSMPQTYLVKCINRNFNVSKFGTGSLCNKDRISVTFDARSDNAKQNQQMNFIESRQKQEARLMPG